MDSLEDVQRQHILHVLERTGGVISGPSGAGAILNVHPNTLRSLMNRLGIRYQAMPRTQRGHEWSQPPDGMCPGRAS
jgi:transcriptional regulator with GAF, ATPase, and Fis domain